MSRVWGLRLNHAASEVLYGYKGSRLEDQAGALEAVKPTQGPQRLSQHKFQSVKGGLGFRVHRFRV